MTNQRTATKPKQVRKAAKGSPLVASLAQASLKLRKLRKDIPKTFLFQSAEEFILQHGQSYQPRPFPAKYRKWLAGSQECFHNAIMLAALFPDKFNYAEGYALPASGLIEVFETLAIQRGLARWPL